MLITAICALVLLSAPVKATDTKHTDMYRSASLMQIFRSEKAVKAALSKIESKATRTKFFAKTVNNRRVICCSVAGGYNYVTTEVFGYYVSGQRVVPFCYYSLPTYFGGGNVSISDALEIKVDVTVLERTKQVDELGVNKFKIHSVSVFVAKPPPVSNTFNTGQSIESTWMPQLKH